MLPPILSTLALLTCSSQTVGGETEALYRWNGNCADAHFGSSIASAGDVNQDGYDDVIVGAPRSTLAGILFVGAAMVYSGVDGSLLYQYRGEGEHYYFGQSVAGCGDVNADGIDDFVVGSVNDIGPLSMAGSAYVYSGATGALLYRLDGQNAGDFFGWRLGPAGDLNQDGYADVMVSAPVTDIAGMYDVGSVYIFSGATGQILLQLNGYGQDDSFGIAFGLAGDVDQDGSPDYLVGARRADPNGIQDAGSAYLFSGSTGSLLYQWDGQEPNGNFGIGIIGPGDVNGDGIPDVLAGANQEGAHGRAYLYSGASGGLLYVVEPKDGAGFGWFVSKAGDQNADGFQDFIISKASGIEGSLYSGATGEPLFDFKPPYGIPAFGGDINADGRIDILLGSPYTNPGGINDAGAAFAISFNPILSPDIYSISASSGGSLSLDLDFPDAAAFLDYKVLISATGTGPSIFGVEVPLTFDAMVLDTFQGIYHIPLSANLQGTLDASGNAAASMTSPSGFSPQLVGRTFYLAAIAHPPGQLPIYSSVSVPIMISQ